MIIKKKYDNTLKTACYMLDKDITWLLKNTRICPNCVLPVEKDKGCSHMRCKMCNIDFDWKDMKNAKNETNKQMYNQIKNNIKNILFQNNNLEMDKIFINTIDGKHIAIGLPRNINNIKVKYIMEMIEVKTGINIDDQRLIYSGKQLKSEFKLLDYDIRKNVTLHLVMRLPGVNLFLSRKFINIKIN